MTRFFFDYTAKEQSLPDYGGHEFPGCGTAIGFAQASAHDLKHSLSENWRGWCVEMRNATGLQLRSVPVNSPELEAA
jgi:hypothetical protein